MFAHSLSPDTGLFPVVIVTRDSFKSFPDLSSVVKLKALQLSPVGGLALLCRDDL